MVNIYFYERSDSMWPQVVNYRPHILNTNYTRLSSWCKCRPFPLRIENNYLLRFFYLCKMSLTSHCVRKVGPDEATSICSWWRVASCVNPFGPGYHGGLVGFRCILTKQLLQRTWGKRARPASTLVATEKATPVKWPFFEKESSTASVEKDCHTSHWG